MEVAKTAAALAGAAIGGYAGYTAASGETMLIQAGSVVLGAAVGAVAMTLIEGVVVENNPIIGLLG